jgi:nucleoside triphosphate diphosphatase
MAEFPGLRRLLKVMARLRDPERGCPWDRAQTPATIAPYTIEEAFEVAEAAEAGNREALFDELGDLLFHVVFHARMAEEAAWFDFDALAERAAEKLEARHPHVFGDAPPAAPADLNRRWEAAKVAEREGIDDGMPAELPALMAALKLQRRAAAVGFDWPDPAGAREKIAEELAELELARREDPDAVAEELGDLLFAVVNLARHLGVEPEQSLRAANRKFVRRFRYIERQLKGEGLRPEDVNLARMDALWDEAKRRDL